MSDPMAEIRASFFIECEELLESLQDGLNLMDDGSSDSETINVVFRAVHSIKGGAGAFGLDDLVQFAHKFETAMDEVRAGRFTPDADAIRLFFSCSDMLGDLVRAARDGEVVSCERVTSIVTNLEALVDIDAAEEDEDLDFTPAVLSLDLNLSDVVSLPDIAGLPPLSHEDTDVRTAGFNITFKPETSLYTSGNEPLYFLRALRDLGDISAKCSTNDLPSLDAFDPETSYLSWFIALETEEPLEAVQEVFEFIDGLCLLDITPKKCPAKSVIDTITPAVTSEFVESAQDLSPAILEAPHPKQTIPELQTSPQTPQKPKLEIAPPPQPEIISKPMAAPIQPRPTVRVDLERCPSSYKVGHQIGLSRGGSGSFV